MTRDYDGSKKWYLAAVEKELMEEHGLTEAEAQAAMDRFQLKEKLDANPDKQLKEETHAAVLSMVKAGSVRHG